MFRKAPVEMSKEVETRLKVLHDMLPEALRDPDFGCHYTSFLRRLRESIHPVGQPEIRKVSVSGDVAFQVDLGDRLGCDFFYGYNLELFETRLFLDLIRPGSVVFDVGANFGFYTVLSAKKCAPSGAVYAFEPDPRSFSLLKQNIAMNKVSAYVRRHSMAAGERNDEVDFYLCEESSFSGFSETGRSRTTKKVRVTSCTLDSFAGQNGIREVDALKIDVEGHEFSVLNGAKEILSNSKNLILMMEISWKNLNADRKAGLEATLGHLYETGMRAWVIDFESNSLVLLKNTDEALKIQKSNIFLVYSGSPQEKRMLDAYKKLIASLETARPKAAVFRGVSGNLWLDLYKNKAISHSYFLASAAGFYKSIKELKGRLASVEKENAERLYFLEKQKKELAELGEIVQTIRNSPGKEGRK